MYFDSAKIPKTYKNLIKICGSEYDHFIDKSNLGYSKLVLITNPNDEKNYGIDD